MCNSLKCAIVPDPVECLFFISKYGIHAPRKSMSLTNGLGMLKELVIFRVMFPKPALLCRQFVSVLSPAH